MAVNRHSLSNRVDENDGHENDGPSKLQGMKLQDRKLQDMKMQDMKMTDKNDGRTRSYRRTNRVLTVCKFLNPKHRNTLCICIRFHTGVCSSRQIKLTLL